MDRIGLLKELTKADKILNLTIIIVALALWSFAISGFLNKPNNIAVIQYKQQELVNINLTKNDGIYSLVFDNNNAEYEIESGKIRFIEMNKELCPNKICSDTGWISSPYQVIVCAPNQLVIKIQGYHNNNDNIDGMVY